MTTWETRGSLNSFNDEQLMQSVRDKDVTKLGILFERHHKSIYHFFYRWFRNGETSEDLTQEVFCRILKYRHSYSSGQPFLAWLFRIAHNVGNDHYRTGPKELPLAEDYDPVSHIDPHQKVQNSMALQHLEKALNQLEPEKRELVILCRFHNLKYKQIAQIFDCSVAAIKVRLHRALKELSLGYRQDIKETAS